MSTLHTTSPSSGNPINVWVVEDNTEFRSTLQHLISSRAGLICPEALGSCEALFTLLNQSFAPDVILMDIGLPGMSGIEGVERLKRISPATQVIMLTIHEDNDTIFKALCAGASGYLLKTAEPARIFEAIVESRYGGTVMTPQIARRVLSMFTQLNTPQWDYGLSDRERDVLQLLVSGLTKQKIADALFLSYHTIDTHMRNIYAKLHVKSRPGAIAKALKERLV